MLGHAHASASVNVAPLSHMYVCSCNYIIEIYKIKVGAEKRFLSLFLVEIELNRTNPT